MKLPDVTVQFEVSEREACVGLREGWLSCIFIHIYTFDTKSFFLRSESISYAVATFQTFPADTPTYLTQENSPKLHILIM